MAKTRVYEFSGKDVEMIREELEALGYLSSTSANRTVEQATRLYDLLGKYKISAEADRVVLTPIPLSPLPGERPESLARELVKWQNGEWGEDITQEEKTNG